MSKICETCGRGALTSVTRSHSNIASPHRQFLNLQRKKIGGKRRRICANCLKTMAKKEKTAT